MKIILLDKSPLLVGDFLWFLLLRILKIGICGEDLFVLSQMYLPLIGIDSFSLFGSYARDEATEDSDLDFVMDDGDLKGLQYVSLVLDLEDEFNKEYFKDLIKFLN